MTAPNATGASRANDCPGQDQTNDALIFGEQDADRKAFQTLRARLALAGHTLSRTEATDGSCSYFVSRWGMVRELRDLQAVEAFAKKAGGPNHG